MLPSFLSPAWGGYFVLTISDLKKVTLFQDLSSAQLQLLYDLVKLRNYQAGELIFTQGQQGDAIFFVIKGRVKIMVMSADGREKIIKVMEPGHVFGEVVLFAGGAYPATAQPMEDCQVGVLRNEDVYSLLRKNTELAINLLQLLARRLRMAQSQLHDLALKDVFTRVTQLVCELAENEGVVLPCGAVEVKLRLTREEMAQLVGTSRETLTRTLSELRQQGLINIDRNQILVPSLARLRAVID